MTQRKRILGLIAMFLWVRPLAVGQSQFASLSGTVADATGAVANAANVTVKNVASGELRKTVTNREGFFSVSTLPAGTYQVTVEMKGFQKWVATGIILNGSDSRTINVPLKVGAETETVEVSALTQEVAPVDTGEKSALISSKELNELALVGRNATEFLKILPGATLSSNGAVNKLAYTGEVVGINGFAVNNNAGGLAGVNVNGQTVGITQDGQNTFDPGAAGAATPVNPNPDMISEVKVMTSNFSAENAKGPVVVNTITKSGGSTFHGDVRFYARNSTLNSEDAFNKAIESDPSNGFTPGQLKGPSAYYYPGFSVGGPVLIPGTGFNKSRHKVFFFESYENYHQLIDGGINRAFVPTAAMLNGDFSALNTFTGIGRFAMGTVPTAPYAGSNGKFFGFNTRAAAGCTISGGVLSSQCIDPAAQLLMADYLPAPTSSTPDANGYNYVAVVGERQNSYQNMVRGDVNITDNTKVYVTWSRQRPAGSAMARLLGLGLWVVFAPAAIGLLPRTFYWRHALPIEGVTGRLLAAAMVHYLNLPGASIVLALMVATSLYLATTFTFHTASEWVDRHFSFVRRISERIQEWKVRRATAREEKRALTQQDPIAEPAAGVPGERSLLAGVGAGVFAGKREQTLEQAGLALERERQAAAETEAPTTLLGSLFGWWGRLRRKQSPRVPRDAASAQAAEHPVSMWQSMPRTNVDAPPVTPLATAAAAPA